MTPIARSVIALAETLESRWKDYRKSGHFDLFVEFTLLLNSLTERLKRKHLPGLMRPCQELENAALAMFGDSTMHPMAIDQVGSSRVDLQACKLEYSIVSPK